MKINLPNILTLLRIVFAPFFCFLLPCGKFLFSFVLFLVLSFTDFFDGMLARMCFGSSDFGKIFDPVADKILNFTVLICLVDLKILPAHLVVLLLLLDLIGFALRIFMAQKGFIISSNWFGKIKTVLQFFAVCFLIVIKNPQILQFFIYSLYVSLVFSVFSLIKFYRLVKNETF
jgi:CDP-diacylglycerol--glycerol-3-phosphate 3-phosphatidyltransferase